MGRGASRAILLPTVQRKLGGLSDDSFSAKMETVRRATPPCRPRTAHGCRSYTIITTEANELMATPLILS
jgi:hypothetical protein